MKKSRQLILIVLCWALTSLMYYFNKQSVSVGIDLMYKVLFSIGICGFGAVCFLFSPNVPRFLILARYFMVYVLPYLLMIWWSLIVWAIDRTSVIYITRGLSTQIYQMIAILAMVNLLYLFGEKGIWVNLAGMVTANMFIILGIVRQGGFIAYIEELKTLILSFGGKTGEMMASAEIHELTFALGVYIAAFLVDFGQLRRHKILAALALFCFLSGFKRIGILALFLAVVVGQFLHFFHKKDQALKKLIYMASAICTILAFSYLVAVKAGIFTYMSEKYGLDTMGRAEMYAMISRYYEMSPLFMGHGTGFVSRLFSDILNIDMYAALHNDYLTVYIDVGFVGFFLWIISLAFTKLRFVMKRQDTTGWIVLFSILTYCLVTYATDNTLNYTYVNAAVAILTIGRGLMVEETAKQIIA